MPAIEPEAELQWIKASRSGVEACVELASAGDGIAIRDSKNPERCFVFSRPAISALLLATKRCQYDHLVHSG